MEPDSGEAKGPIRTAEQAGSAESNDDAKRRWELFTEHLKQTWQDIQSSTDSFDQSLLSLSTGALALSLAFIKDIVSLDQAVWLDVLYVSWFLFIVCIVSTLVSYQLSIASLNAHLEHLPKFYYENETKEKKHWSRTALHVTTWVSAIAFISGIICIMLFGIENTARAHMTERVDDLHGGRAPISATAVPGGTDAEKRGRAPIQPTAVPQAPQTVPGAPKSEQPSPSPASAPPVPTHKE